MKRLPGGRRTLVGTALAVLLLLACGLALKVQGVRKLRAAARTAVAAGRYPEARRRLDAWLKAEPASAEAHYLKARVALGTDHLDDLAAGLKQAEFYGYPETELAVLKAIIGVKQGRYVASEPVLSQAFEAARGPDRLVDEALAKVYLETYNLALAEPVIARWARDAPDDPKPYLWRVEVDRRKSDVEAVIRDYRQALTRDPERHAARLGLADELRGAHRCAEAAVEYAAYLARRPDDPAAQFGMGCNALELGDETAALHHFERVFQLDPKHGEAHREYGELDRRRGELTKALAHFDLAMEAEPNDLKTRNCRALTLSQLGRDKEARIERAVVARLRQEQQDVERFRLRLLQDTGDAALQCEAARWMFNHGHVREGIRWAEEATRNHPGYPEACNLLAAHYERVGNRGLANFYRLQSPTPNSRPAESPASVNGRSPKGPG